MKYNISSNATKSEISTLKPRFDFYSMAGGVQIDKQENIISSTLPYEKTYSKFVENGTFNTSATFAGKVKDVDVKVVDLDYEKTSYVSKLGPLLQIFDDFNYVSNKLEKFGFPCKATFLSKGSDWKSRPTDFDLSLATYNEEIKTSRLAEHREDYTLKMSKLKLFEFKCSKAIGWGSFSLGDFYASLSMTPEASITVRNATNIETKANKWSGFGTIALPLKTEVGLEKKPNGIFDYNISVPIVAGAKMEYPFDGDVKRIGGYLYFDRVNLNITANIDIGIFGQKDVKLTYVLLDTNFKGFKNSFNIIDAIK